VTSHPTLYITFLSHWYTSPLVGRGTKIILERLFFQSLAHYKKLIENKMFLHTDNFIVPNFLISGFAGKMKVHFKLAKNH